MRTALRKQLLFAIALNCIGLAQTPASIQSLVTAGTLEQIFWPNFTDYRASLQTFYEPTGYAPGWL